MSPVCPECGDAHFSQTSDSWRMCCGNGHYFVLVKLTKRCANCGQFKVLNPNGLCVECIAKIIAKEVK